MVVALYVVAGVMVVGGLMSIYSGSDIIVMERGWTMVIAGSVVAASGALLAGIATAVARLQDLHNEFARVSHRLARPQAPPFAASQEMTADMTAERAPPVERPSPPPLVAVPDIREHRDLDITPEPILGSTSTPEPVAAPALAMKAPATEREPPAIVAEREPLLIEPEAPMVEHEVAVVEREPVPEAAPSAAEDAAPTIVGTYNSGGNFYIMYSDGAIEAETPAGKFRFNSLDELKDFIAAGGDKAKATS
jgi:hypothetical protein